MCEARAGERGSRPTHAKARWERILQEAASEVEHARIAHNEALVARNSKIRAAGMTGNFTIRELAQWSRVSHHHAWRIVRGDTG